MNGVEFNAGSVSSTCLATCTIGLETSVASSSAVSTFVRFNLAGNLPANVSIAKKRISSMKATLRALVWRSYINSPQANDANTQSRGAPAEHSRNVSTPGTIEKYIYK